VELKNKREHVVDQLLLLTPVLLILLLGQRTKSVVHASSLLGTCLLESSLLGTRLLQSSLLDTRVLGRHMLRLDLQCSH
jgi:hypothetical protein